LDIIRQRRIDILKRKEGLLLTISWLKSLCEQAVWLVLISKGVKMWHLFQLLKVPVSPLFKPF